MKKILFAILLGIISFGCKGQEVVTADNFEDLYYKAHNNYKEDYKKYIQEFNVEKKDLVKSDCTSLNLKIDDFLFHVELSKEFLNARGYYMSFAKDCNLTYDILNVCNNINNEYSCYTNLEGDIKYIFKENECIIIYKNKNLYSKQLNYEETEIWFFCFISNI